MSMHFTYSVIAVVLFACSIESQRNLPRQCWPRFKVGHCRARLPRFYYNATTNQCDSFFYGGCGNNANYFETIEACRRNCTVQQREKKWACYMGRDVGTTVGYCRRRSKEKGERWYFDDQENRCFEMNYTGCGGNQNNFKSKEECLNICNNGTTGTTGSPPTTVSPTGNSTAGNTSTSPDPGTTVAPGNSSSGTPGTSPGSGTTVAPGNSTNNSSSGTPSTPPGPGTTVAPGNSSTGAPTTPPGPGTTVAPGNSSPGATNTSPGSGTTVAPNNSTSSSASGSPNTPTGSAATEPTNTTTTLPI